MMGSSVDRMRGVEWVNFANQMDYSEIDETGRDFPNRVIGSVGSFR